MLLILAVLEDRIAGNANKWIDDNSNSFLLNIRSFLNWLSTQDILGIAGLVLVGTFLVLMIWSFFQKDDQDPPKRLRQEPSGIEFFGTIDELRARHPLPETFKNGNELHAYFLSGEGVFAEDNQYIKYVKRLILPHQEAANLATIQTLSSVAYVDFKSQITKTLNLAGKNAVQVRLFQDFIGMSLLFCNPDQRNGWAQVGLIIPGTESRERPHLRLYKATHEEEVLSLYNTFNIIWNASRIPESEFISMKDAARKLYEAAKQGKIPFGEASEKLSGWLHGGPANGSPGDILHWWAGKISKDLSVYGMRPPSSILAEIPRREVQDFIFSDEATKLRDPINDSIYYENVAVKIDALDAQYNFEAGFHSESSH